MTDSREMMIFQKLDDVIRELEDMEIPFQEILEALENFTEICQELDY